MKIKATFRFLEKDQVGNVLPDLFQIYYENMEKITPFPQPYETEKQQWLEEVGNALKKDARQIVLIFLRKELVGFMMYYVNPERLMIEELQIKESCRYQGIPYFLGRFLLERIEEKPQYVEGFAHPQNHHSRKIMAHLGMEKVGQAQQGTLCHYRGELTRASKKVAR